MKIIDLLNKIANGEEVPKKIKIETHIFTKYNYPMGDGTFVSSYESNNDGEYHINDFLYPQYLNDEIEIIEEKKIPEEIECYHQYSECVVVDKYYQDQKGSLVDEIIIDKINDIIDYLKSKGK